MLAYRVAFRIKKGRMQEALALFKAGVIQPSVPNAAIRVYTPKTGPLDVLVFERVYESAADEAKAHAEYSARSEAAEFWQQLNELAESGGSAEIWHVAEWRWE